MRDRSREATASPTGSRMEPRCELSEKHWLLIADLFPETSVGPEGGRPVIPARPCVEGILWVLRTGSRWQDLPRHFPSPATCWRRLKAWTESGVWEKAWSRLLRALDRKGRIQRAESFADGTFCAGKKGVKASARRSAARAPSSWFSPTAMACRCR
jgi:transposase